MVTVTIGEAKAQLTELMERALAGEEVIIARRSKPLVRMMPADPPGLVGSPGDDRDPVAITM